MLNKFHIPTMCTFGILRHCIITHSCFSLFAVPPKIHSVSGQGRITARKGSRVVLNCSATGHPKPQIHWERKVSGVTKRLPKMISQNSFGQRLCSRPVFTQGRDRMTTRRTTKVFPLPFRLLLFLTFWRSEKIFFL